MSDPSEHGPAARGWRGFALVAVIAVAGLIGIFMASPPRNETPPTCQDTEAEDSLSRMPRIAVRTRDAQVALTDGFDAFPLPPGLWTCVPRGFFAVLQDDRQIGEIDLHSQAGGERAFGPDALVIELGR